MTRDGFAMADQGFFDIAAQLSGRRVVVVGGDADAYRHVLRLLEWRADVALFAAEAVPALAGLAQQGRIRWERREYRAGDLAGAWYLVAAARDESVNAAACAEALDRRIFTAAGIVATATTDGTGTTGAERNGRLGRVALVGAGPGDPGLITVRGRQLLDEALLVVADRLVPAALLTDLAPGVELVDGAKFPRGPARAQKEINRILIEGAREGKPVVRLKGGDPFVFGRGLEEVEACVEAGVPCTVVPGVSSAIGVPGVLGIPVSHRGVAHEFTVVSGHVPPESPQSLVNWRAIAALHGTVVVLMGVEFLGDIAACLIRHGRDAATAVCVIQEGATSQSRALRATLGEVGHAAKQAGIRPPAVTVIGDVVDAASGAWGHTDPARWNAPSHSDETADA